MVWILFVVFISKILILLDVVNIILTIFFILEVLLKLVVFQKRFFSSGWNIFNLLVTFSTVVIMFVGIGIDMVNGPQKCLIVIMRLLRMLILLNKIPLINDVFHAFLHTLPGIMSTGGIMMVVEFIFSMFGVFLLCNTKFQINLTVHDNFINFWSSFPTMIRIASGENWNGIMHDLTRGYSQYFQCVANPTYYQYVANSYTPVGCGWDYTPIFFILFQLIFTFIFLNLFIVVVVGSMLEINAIAKTVLNDKNLKKFQKAWAQYDPDVNKYNIHESRVLVLSNMET